MEVQWGQVDSYSEVQSVNGLTGKVQLKIPTKTSDLTNDSGFITEVSGDVATKDELTAVENKIPDVSGFATKTEVATDISNVKSLIPDTSGFAEKSDIEAVEAAIPTEYLKSASVADNTLTITDASGNATTFTGGGSGGGAVDSVNGQTGTVVIDIPTKVSELENDSGYLTSHQDISNLATKAALDEAAAKIPTEYIKSASISNNNLVLTDATGTEVIDKQAVYIDTQITEITSMSSYDYVSFDLSLPSLTCAEVSQLVQNGYNVYLRVTGEILQNLGCDVVIAPCTVASNTVMGFFAFAYMDHIIYCYQDDDASSFDGIYAAVPFETDLDGRLKKIKNSIPTTYLKTASVSNNTLTLTDASGTNIEFTGGSTTDLSSYSNTAEVQTMINTAISNITNANEVSY